jgi:RNA polymerase sigma-70 factor, ECF subfamily
VGVSKPGEIGAGVLMASGEFTLQAGEGLVPVAEAGLVAACRRGDERAFETLVALHERMVYGLAARLLGDQEEARDLAQDVFLQVFRTVGSFRGHSSLRTWIYRIVVNLCRNRHRFWQRRARHRSCGLDELSGAEELRVSRPGVPSPFEMTRRSERARQVQRALLRLKFDHRLVLVLREVEGLSCDEVAATLGVAVGTVKSRLARARDAFRKAVTPDLQQTVGP